RSVLPRRFRWWAGLLGLHGRVSAGERDRRLLAPAFSMSASGPLQRAFSPALIRAGGMFGGRTLRLDLHPADLQHPRHMIALEWVLGRAGGRRQAITYDELLATAN
ncbi:MAG TPA: hypothetical protein VK761_02715, partial [Solirubrobacteraceae bacterium]|nr:hypothetical protein [Solirubrobacteraceae bacterium]